MSTTRSTLLAMVAAAVVLAAPAVLGDPAALRVGALFMLALATMAGLHLVTGLTKVVSLCHAALVGVGAYTAGILSRDTGMSPIGGVAAGAVVAAACGLLLAAITRRLEDHYLALATLAASEILTNIFRGAADLTGGANGLFGVPPISIGSWDLTSPDEYYPACTFVGLTSLVVVWLVDRSLLGRGLRAMGDEGPLVESLGASASALRMWGFALGGSLAGLAGAVGAHVDGFVGPESYGAGLSVAYLCFLVIGGLGRLRGVVLGAALASVGPELLRGLLEWQMIAVALVSLVALVARSRSWPRWFRRMGSRSVAELGGETP